MDINEELKAAYEIWWRFWGKNVLSHQIDGHPITNPYLLSVEQERYDRCQLKCMILGKETNVWGSEIPQAYLGVDMLMALYHNFVNEDWGDDHCFWRFVSALREWSRDEQDDNILWIPDNISKVGRPGIGTDEDVFFKLIEKVNLVKLETRILDPDLIIILNGDKSYDKYLRAVYGDFVVESESYCGVSVLSLGDEKRLALRCNHPQSLQLNKNWDETLMFLEAMVEICLSEKQ